jgi:hypothetical protein
LEHAGVQVASSMEDSEPRARLVVVVKRTSTDGVRKMGYRN